MSENYEETIDRKVHELDDGKIQVQSKHVENFQPARFMQMFRKKVNTYRQMVNQHSNMEDEIEERLGEYGDQMGVMHVLDESQEQGSNGATEKIGHNTLSEGAITAYVEVQQYKSKKEQLEDDLHDLEDDIKDIWGAAKQVVREHDDIEMPKPVKLLDNFLPEDEINEFFPGKAEENISTEEE